MENILIKNHFIYTKYFDNVYDLTVIIFTKLMYQNKTLYFKFYQVSLKQQKTYNEKDHVPV